MDSQNNEPSSFDSNNFAMLMKASSSNLGSMLAPSSSTETNSSTSSSSQQQQPHQLVSTNSFELTGTTTTSLSEDSGLPHTNSSISSGDSIRVGLCRFEFEVSAANEPFFSNTYLTFVSGRFLVGRK